MTQESDLRFPLVVLPRIHFADSRNMTSDDPNPDPHKNVYSRRMWIQIQEKIRKQKKENRSNSDLRKSLTFFRRVGLCRSWHAVPIFSHFASSPFCILLVHFETKPKSFVKILPVAEIL